MQGFVKNAMIFWMVTIIAYNGGELEMDILTLSIKDFNDWSKTLDLSEALSLVCHLHIMKNIKTGEYSAYYMGCPREDIADNLNNNRIDVLDVFENFSIYRIIRIVGTTYDDFYGFISPNNIYKKLIDNEIFESVRKKRINESNNIGGTDD